jgi:hypothetical protein
MAPKSMGPLGYAQIELGGLTIPNQEISALNYASFGGIPEGDVSGLLGLAYANLTFAYPGPAYPDVNGGACFDGICGPIPYSPFTQTLFDAGKIKPIFSFAINRSSKSGGAMTIGGIPDLHDPECDVTRDEFGMVPIRPLRDNVLISHAVDVDGLVYAGAKDIDGQGRCIGKFHLDQHFLA